MQAEKCKIQKEPIAPEKNTRVRAFLLILTSQKENPTREQKVGRREAKEDQRFDGMWLNET